jgi:hypothetical protein
MRAYLHRLVLSGQSGGYARNLNSPGSRDATLRAYLRQGDAKPGELLALARQLRIGTVMAEVLEPLLT